VTVAPAEVQIRASSAGSAACLPKPCADFQPLESRRQRRLGPSEGMV